MMKVWKGSTVRAAVGAALSAAVLVGCGSSGSTSTSASTSTSTSTSGSTSTSRSSVTTLAPATGPKLDIASIKTKTEVADAFESTLSITIKASGQELTQEQVFTVNKTDKRVRMESKPNTVSRAFTMISGVGNDLYLKGSSGWTKLTVDPSLLKTSEGIAEATSLVDMVGKLEAEIRQDGTKEVDGVTVKRYRANVDGEKLFAWFKNNGPLKQMASKMPEATDVVGSVELGVDDSGFARSIDIKMAFTANNEANEIAMITRSKPLPAGTKVEPPPADQITSTKSVATAEELGTAMQAAIS